MNLILNLTFAGKDDILRRFNAIMNKSDIDVITLEEAKALKRKPFDFFRRLKSKRCEKSVVVIHDLNNQTKIRLYKILSVLIRSRHRYIGDSKGEMKRVSRIKVLLIDLPITIFVEPILSAVVLAWVWLRAKILFMGSPRNKPLGEIEKISYLRTDLWMGTKVGGSVGHIAGVANAFHSLGYKLFFVSSDELEMIDRGIPVNVIKPSSMFNLISEVPNIAYNIRFTKFAKNIINTKKPDLIYQRYSLDNFSGVEISQELGIPFVLEYNGSEVWIAKNWGKPLKFQRLAELIEEINLKYADLIVVVSRVMKDELTARGVDERKILVNPNCVNPEVFNSERFSSEDINSMKDQLGIERNKILVGFIGTFSAWHGAEVLARTVKEVVRNNDNIHFLMIGDGPLMKDVKDIISGDKVENFVTLTGLVPQNQAPKYLAICDILTSPHVPNPDGTPFFGSPTKLFEYMAMGKGIVASDLEQIGEVLGHNKTAWLVKPGNVGELAEGILTLAQSKELRERLGKNAREEALAKYTWEKNVRNVIERLNDILEKRGDVIDG
ncbi:MAG: glycosyltransferase family 4 protein [bacterium]